MQKITACLWFDNQAEEAINHYISIFNDAKLINVTRYGSDDRLPEGTLFTALFQLEGQQFMALNGGPHHKFNDAISLFVDCQSQPEVDTLWERLLAGGEAQMCGWLKDKYGLSWQIVPSVLIEMMQDKDPEKAKRVTEAMLQMVKIDIPTLQQAYADD